MTQLDVLILGAGWIGEFLIPLLQTQRLAFAATTRDGRAVAGADTIAWGFDPIDEEQKDISNIPLAKYVVVVFPLKGVGQSKLLVESYSKAHGVSTSNVHFIQLGSTGIWDLPRDKLSDPEWPWVTRYSPYNTSNERAIAEDELLTYGGCVLNLSGLWGGQRDPKHWVSRGTIGGSKEAVSLKKSLHLIHGEDVARAIVAVTSNWEAATRNGNGRWMLTDGFVYDWWSLFAAWADETESSGGGVDRSPSKQAQWVYELMVEEEVRALPRSMETLGRCYDTREFWNTFRLAPLKAGL
ncbi:hypothetical protein SERLA73DRAFT_93676 [Serpula lacrymans var. lacrymans S7.3]|uniref:NAD(P)-binding domain-containing protein n=2 Tax=Serpula lacrymans var. lacrymans TaxID=341189 RepID=F8Q4D2_SERL3|nr:uncharacterized protein SERLADRAFT_416991 [Serpula lacrymans var. lacrymans S7.9]EGN96987.1 hypothetical protein SERLA73DRAFT_93676 [Serpula lacrymans var. lacrymans S7.3]EGO22578.1 hypothetical protein SERLADRAFT_416991 [Serpula lacrymans var. lacrymans S7.9]